MPSAGQPAKAALVSMLTTAYASAHPEVAVYPGHPGPVDVADLVAVTSVAAQQEPGPMRVGARTREESLRITAVISCYRGGGVEVQPTVTAAAFTLLGVLEDAIADDPTLAGTVTWAQVESYDLAEADDPDILAAGRVSEISVVVQATARNTPTP